VVVVGELGGKGTNKDKVVTVCMFFDISGAYKESTSRAKRKHLDLCICPAS
jgi:hypothetical protein